MYGRLGLWTALVFCACAQIPNANDPETDFGDSQTSVFGGDSDADGDADTDSDSDADADSDGDADADSDSDADGDGDADADSDGDTDADPDTATATDTVDGIESESGIDTELVGDTDADADGDADTDADADGDADSDTADTADSEDDVVLVIEESSPGYCAVDGVVETVNAGFTGTGYLNTDNASGTGILWHIVGAGGSVSFAWRYALDGTENRDARLSVNGESVTAEVSFVGTGGWDSWKEVAVRAPLPAGDNAVRLEALGANGLANIDNVTLTGRGIVSGDCADINSDPDTAETDAPSDSGEATDVDTQALPAISVYIAGDSTVSNYTDTPSTTDQAGWGQMLHEYLIDSATVDNRARGGRTALWFYLEGGVQGILDVIRPGDYFLIQFGTNDSHTTATFEVDGVTYQRYAEPDGAFKEHLKTYYLDPIRAKGAIPVMVTAPPRNSAYCTGGNSLGAYAQAMRELGAAEDVAVSDLNDKTVTYLKNICPAPTPEDFYLLKSDGTVDGTHFQENGARILAGFVMDGIKETGLGLASYRK